MKIAIAQIQSLAGKIEHNLQRHLECVKTAAAKNCDLIVFPELSLTGYEPLLAADLAFNLPDPRLDIFQQQSDEQRITIVIGIPTRTDRGVLITMMIFRPNQDFTSYSKRYLHEDELPYFISGTSNITIPLEGATIVPAICYESLLSQHATEANTLGATIYMASVAKPMHGIEKAQKHYPKIAQKHQMVVLMVNNVGPSDNFIGAGTSAVWDTNGEIMGSLNETEEKLLIWNSADNSTLTVMI